MGNHNITLGQAVAYTTRFRIYLSDMLNTDFAGALSYSETFDAKAIQAILNQPGCVGFRAYHGMKADNKVCTIFVGVNANNEDMIDTLHASQKPTTADGIIVNEGATCPPFCPPPSDLNP